MKNVPKIRFKGFDTEWEENRLGDIGITYSGLSGKTKEDFGFGDAEYVTYMNVFSNSISDRIMTDKVEIDAKQNKVEYGDIFFTVSSETPEEVGMSSVWLHNDKDKDIYLNSFCFGYRLTYKVNPYYIAYLLRSPIPRNSIILLAQGISRYNISKNKVMNIDVLLPPIEEQEKIGNFFQNIDRLITAQQNKISKLKNIKSACLDKMFPKKGSNTPEIRFKGFSGEWEEKMLDSISDVRDGTHDSPNYLQEGYPFITSKNVRDGYLNFDEVQYISKDDFVEINKRSKVDINDILMGMIGTIGNIALVREEPNFAIKNVALIKDTKGSCFLFLYYSIQSYNVRVQLHEGMDGGTQKFIALNKVRNLMINLPTIKEQTLIGRYLSALDNLIQFNESKLTKLKNIKASFLNKMFVTKE